MFSQKLLCVSALLFWSVTAVWPNTAKADACDDTSNANITRFKDRLSAIPDTARDGRCQVATAALDFWSSQKSLSERFKGSCATVGSCDAECMSKRIEENRTAVTSYCGAGSACFDGKMIAVEGTVVRVYFEKDLWKVILSDLDDDQPGAVKACNFGYYVAAPKNMPDGAIILQFYEKPSCRVGSRAATTIKASKDPVLRGLTSIESGGELTCR